MPAVARGRAGTAAAAPGRRLLRRGAARAGDRTPAALLLREGRRLLPAEPVLRRQDAAVHRHRDAVDQADDVLHPLAPAAPGIRRAAPDAGDRDGAAAAPRGGRAARPDPADGRADGAGHRPLTNAEPRLSA